MRYLSRGILPGGLGFAVAVLVAACGGGSALLSSGQSGNLNRQLDAVAAAINAGRCDSAAAAAQAFDHAVGNLTTVNPVLTDNLKQASLALAQQAGPDCQNRQAPAMTTTASPKTTSTATTPTTPTQTATTPTNTATSPANTTTAPATTPTSPGNTTTTGGSGGAGIGNTSTGSGGTSAGG